MNSTNPANTSTSNRSPRITQLPEENSEHEERDQEERVPDVPGPARLVRSVQAVDQAQQAVGEQEERSTDGEDLHASNDRAVTPGPPSVITLASPGPTQEDGGAPPRTQRSRSHRAR